MPDTGANKQPNIDNGFGHSPLNLNSAEIRLLKLVPRSNDKERVHAVIQHFDLSKAPPFKALSYTWGFAHPVSSIYVNGKAFSVRSNLFAFLETFGPDPDICGDTWLWIDQVCIQQANVDERNHQVQQMAEIYRFASEVIVWLGPGAAYSESLLQEVNELKESPSYCSNIALFTVVQLLDCEYWTRTWVIQEFVLASSMILCWGTTKFGFDALEVLLRVGGQHIRDRHCQAQSLLQKINQISELVSQRSTSRQNGFKIRSWKRALMLSSYTNCQDVRDRIYSLLGLVHSEISIVPNYTVTDKDVFVEVLAVVAVEESIHQEGFLATKALVSRALGLGNRPLDELSHIFFDGMSSMSLYASDTLSHRRRKEKAVKCLWEWIERDSKHIFGTQTLSSFLHEDPDGDSDYPPVYSDDMSPKPISEYANAANLHQLSFRLRQLGC